MRISWFFEKASLTIFKLIFCLASTKESNKPLDQ